MIPPARRAEKGARARLRIIGFPCNASGYGAFNSRWNCREELSLPATCSPHPFPAPRVLCFSCC